LDVLLLLMLVVLTRATVGVEDLSLANWTALLEELKTVYTFFRKASPTSIADPAIVCPTIAATQLVLEALNFPRLMSFVVILKTGALVADEVKEKPIVGGVEHGKVQ